MGNLLENRTAVVTGASSGVGRSIALALAAEGATVCLLGRRLDALESVALVVRGEGKRPRTYPLDLTAEDEVLRFAGEAERDVGGVDILVHSAGVIFLGTVEDSSASEIDTQLAGTLRAPCLVTKALLPLIRARQGQIVFINSTAGLGGVANAAYYAAAKHGLKGFADSLRDEVNGDGVRVLSVFLGRTATPMQEAIHRIEGKTYHPALLIQPEDIASILISALTLPRTAEITDIIVRPFVRPAP